MVEPVVSTPVEPTTFGARLRALMDGRGALCAGIDPHPSLLLDWGLTDDVEGLERFALTAVEGLAPHVAVVKPQSAFYERFGSRGIAVLERVVAESRAAGALVLLDVKRGDIGSTSQAYADAYLDPSSPLACDAITVSPYLGFGSLEPFFDTARRCGAGVFVLALTSNKEGSQVQHAVPEPTGPEAAGRDDGQAAGTVGGLMLDELRRLNADAEPLGSFGAVVGATIDATDPAGQPWNLAFNGPILAPGFGEQGGGVADLARIFGSSLDSVLPSSSRGLLRQGPSAAALSEAVRRVQRDLRHVR